MAFCVPSPNASGRVKKIAAIPKRGTVDPHDHHQSQAEGKHDGPVPQQRSHRGEAAGMRPGGVYGKAASLCECVQSCMGPPGMHKP